jgi:integrase
VAFNFRAIFSARSNFETKTFFVTPRLWLGNFFGKAGKKAWVRLFAATKRRPPVPLALRLLAHFRRWQRTGIAKEFFVEWNGKAVSSVKTATASAVRLAGLSAEHGNMTLHPLRHTAATWLMQNGVFAGTTLPRDSVSPTSAAVHRRAM